MPPYALQHVLFLVLILVGISVKEKSKATRIPVTGHGGL
jgi:hypothetical protein